MHRIIPPLLAGLLLAQSAGAEIYKCRLPGGKVEISNSPCPGGSGTVAVRPEEAVSEANRQQAERDVARMRNFVEPAGKRPARRSSRRTPGAKPASGSRQPTALALRRPRRLPARPGPASPGSHAAGATGSRMPQPGQAAGPTTASLCRAGLRHPAAPLPAPQAAPAATAPAARQCGAERAEHGHLCAGQALQPLSKRKTQPHRK